MTLPERIPGIGRKAGSRRTPRDAAIHTDVPQAAKPPQGIHDRLCLAAGDKSYRTLAFLTGTHAEAVRRYMVGQAPSVAFLTGFCRAQGINAHWLLCGQGPMRIADMPEVALRRASAAELTTALGHQIESLSARLEALEAAAEAAGILQRLPTSPPERLQLRLTDAKARNDGPSTPADAAGTRDAAQAEGVPDGTRAEDASGAAGVVETQNEMDATHAEGG